jgi:tRNA nucleotidyltransferase (CCA-adding enzyme)
MQKECKKILKEVLVHARPKPEEKKKLTSLAKKALDIANKEAKKFKAKAILAGSLTRDTWLPSKMEFEIFVLFPTKLPDKKMEETGLKLGKDIVNKLKGNYRIEYAEHPYVRGRVQEIDIDIVPCFEVKSTKELKSAVDRTPFHVKYVEKNLPASKSDEVRLLKQFLTANGIYGADAKTEGFSGYVCELLIIEYGKFLDALKAVSNWQSSEIIDIEKYYSKKDYHHLKKQFSEQVLILIDPTDKNRNTAAAVSTHSFFKFKKIAKEFLENPRAEMFFKRKLEPINENELIQNQLKRRTELIFVKFKPPEVVPDILWPQMRRFSDRLMSVLKENEFVVLRKDVYTDEKSLAVVLLEMEISKLPIIQKRIGPKVFDLDDSKRFLEKYRQHVLAGPFIEDNFWAVETRRKFLSAREKLGNSLNEKVEILKAKGIPSYIAEQLGKGFEIFSDNEKVIELVEKDRNFGVFLRRYFEKESLA